MNKYSISKQPLGVLAEVAQKHKIVRKSLHYTQADLADRSGVSLGSIKRFEQTGKIAFESLLKLLNVLDRLEGFDCNLDIDEDIDSIEKLFTATK